MTSSGPWRLLPLAVAIALVVLLILVTTRTAHSLVQVQVYCCAGWELIATVQGALGAVR